MKIVNTHEKPLFVHSKDGLAAEVLPHNPLVLTEEQVDEGVFINFENAMRGQNSRNETTNLNLNKNSGGLSGAGRNQSQNGESGNTGQGRQEGQDGQDGGAKSSGDKDSADKSEKK